MAVVGQLVALGLTAAFLGHLGTEGLEDPALLGSMEVEDDLGPVDDPDESQPLAELTSPYAIFSPRPSAIIAPYPAVYTPERPFGQRPPLPSAQQRRRLLCERLDRLEETGALLGAAETREEVLQC